MKKIVIICTFLAASVSMGGHWIGAEAAGPPPCKGFHGGGGEAEGHAEPPAIMAKVLRLSEVQQAKIMEISREGRDELMSLMRKMEENRRLLHEKRGEAKFDETGVRALAEKEGKLVASMIVSQEAMQNRIRAVLTPEQRDLHDRIQPLLQRRPLPLPAFCGGKFPPSMGMEMAHLQNPGDREIPPLMGPAPGDCLLCVDED